MALLPTLAPLLLLLMQLVADYVGGFAVARAKNVNDATIQVLNF